jgi:predicted short-subunit dehydrogenase-like oxidoreductase (DUF2520 family)
VSRALSILIIGRGRLGRGLARAFSSTGVRVTTWAGRGRWARSLPDVAGVVLAVPDRAVRETSARVVQLVTRPVVVLHVSGSLGPRALSPAENVSIGVMHPLASVAGVPSPSFARATFVIDGERAAVALARRLARALGARPLVHAIHGPRYHAAASLLANGAAALATRAVDLLEGLGLSRREAERAAGGLLGTVSENVARLGVPASLTGPIVRGDAETVRRHREALANDAASLRAYDAIAPLVLETARAAGLSDTHARSVRAALSPRRRTRGSQRR